MDYKNKYLKYKQKYINLKTLQKGGVDNIKINAYVISLQNNQERLTNIQNNINKLGKIKLNIEKAVFGLNIDISKLKENEGIDDNDVINGDTERRKRELGCYLSHRNIIEKIKNNDDLKNNYDYTLILEDDFNITTNNIENNIIEILEKLRNINITDFDIIWFGTNNSNHGKQVIDNIYEVDCSRELWGNHGYLLNNKNINKFYSAIKKIIDQDIDVVYWKKVCNKELIGYVIFPNLIGISRLKTTLMHY